MVGTTDEHIAQVCKAEGRAIITLDLDFSDMRRYPYQEYEGIIEKERLSGRLWIVEEKQVRIRD